MFPHKTIFYSLLFTAFVVLNFSPASAEIIFQDNFDNSPDWQSNQTVHKSQQGGYDIGWGSTRADTCTTNCPPQGWTSYRAASSFWTDDRRKDTYVLNSEGARGNQGKGITFNAEVSGDYGTWAGGSLDLWLGETGYDELYVRYYLKYSTSWKWTNPENTQHCQQKLIRISTFNDNVWTSDSSPQQYQSIGLNRPVYYPDWYYNKSYPPDTKLYVTILTAPNYSEESSTVYNDVIWPNDGNWHSYEFHVKMNSAPGVNDGVWGFYIDGVLLAERTDVPWKEAGSNTTHNWNWLMFLDNITNGSSPMDTHTEMPLYMDDVVVSTEYIGPDPAGKSLLLDPPTF
jgi:hypothetical protein